MDSAVDSIQVLSDESLIEACLESDQDAWRELVVRYNRLVLAIPRHYGFSDEDAEDVFQTVFATLVQQLGKLRDRRSLAKWLITTAHRTSWRLMERSECATSLEYEQTGLTAEDPPPELVIRWERRHLVRTAVRRLGGRCEKLLTALYLDETRPTYDQIARRLDIPRGSIGPSRARCLVKLLAVLGDVQDDNVP